MMHSPAERLVVVPAHNQAATVGRVVYTLAQRLRRQEKDAEDAGHAEPLTHSQRVGSRFSSS
jgi:hypothetical protein